MACARIRDELPGRDSRINRRTGLSSRYTCKPTPKITAMTATAMSNVASRMPRNLVSIAQTPAPIMASSSDFSDPRSVDFAHLYDVKELLLKDVPRGLQRKAPACSVEI